MHPYFSGLGEGGRRKGTEREKEEKEKKTTVSAGLHKKFKTQVSSLSLNKDITKIWVKGDCYCSLTLALSKDVLILLKYMRPAVKLVLELPWYFEIPI